VIPAVNFSIFPLGDSAITIDLGNHIAKQLNTRALALHDWLQAHRFPGLADIIIAYSSVSAFYDPDIVRLGRADCQEGVFYCLKKWLEQAWEAMADAKRLAHCAPEEVRRLVRVRSVLADALETRDSVPLADWLETTWLRLGAADAYPKEDLRHARAFLAALSDRAASGEWNGPRDLGSLLGELYAQPQASTSNPVQIMTIHRILVGKAPRETVDQAAMTLLIALGIDVAEGRPDIFMSCIMTESSTQAPSCLTIAE